MHGHLLGFIERVLLPGVILPTKKKKKKKKSHTSHAHPICYSPGVSNGQASPSTHDIVVPPSLDDKRAHQTELGPPVQSVLGVPSGECTRT